jgi:hypothetical protein
MTDKFKPLMKTTNPNGYPDSLRLYLFRPDYQRADLIQRRLIVFHYQRHLLTSLVHLHN